jgi:hypothetical protein
LIDPRSGGRNGASWLDVPLPPLCDSSSEINPFCELALAAICCRRFAIQEGFMGTTHEHLHISAKSSSP